MQVKVFEASDMNSGLKMVKEALGPDALILSTKTLHNGKLGVLGKPTLEITAAVDSTWPEKAPATEKTREQKMTIAKQPSVPKDITYQQLWASEEMHEQSQHQDVDNLDDPRELACEINELRSIISCLSKRIGNLDTAVIRSPYIEPEYSGKNPDKANDPVTQLLCSRGISHQVAELVSRFTRDSSGQIDYQDTVRLQNDITEAVARLFTVKNPLSSRLTEQKRICLIGPTGVGKTTTIAKLAAGYLNRFGGKIALITIDTYRIAAVEQLKVYGEIMNVPVEVVIQPQDMGYALARHSDCDLILIDTAGRSPNNSFDIEEMTSFLRPELALENHLMLSATSREIEMETIIQRFSCLPIEHFIFSKVDECTLLGVLLNIHYQNDTPISFLTNGQRVPEDIIAPDQKTIAELIMNKHRKKNNG